jgi:imidazole glycerol phosphate synthase glutamine amidotransferase subunit
MAAQRVILPGVGAFGAAMGEIDRLGLRRAIADRISEGRPTLAVCVGMQILFEKSDESPDVAGLGVVQGDVGRFPTGLRVPNMGWHQISAAPDSTFVEPGWAYFANSYRAASPPPGWTVSMTEYGGEFCAAIEKDLILACQFHPELSGDWGHSLLRRWIEATGGMT